MQYRKLPWINEYRDAVSAYIQDNYYDFLLFYIYSLSLKRDSDIIYQLIRDYYGLSPLPWGTQTSKYKYDTGLKYDSGYIYDAGNDSYKGYVDAINMVKFAKFVLDYSSQVFNLDTFVGFLAEFCGVTKAEIGIELTDMTHTFILPNNESSATFVQMIDSGAFLPGLPYGVEIVKYRIGDAK